MKQEDMEKVLWHMAGQLDDIQVELAALGTVTRALMDLCPDKEALRIRINRVLSESAAKPMSPEAMAALEARHDALLKRLG